MGWSMVQSVVRSVQSVLQAKHVLLHTPYNGRPASDAWTSVAQAADSGLRTVWYCGGVAVLRKGCGGVAVVWRWSAQWSQSMVRSVVRWLVWSGGPVGGLVGGPVGGPVGGAVGGLVCGVVGGPACGPVRAVCGPSKHVLLHTMACRLQMLGYWSASGLAFFCSLCKSQKPGPGSAHTCPQNVVRAASLHRLRGSAQVHAAIVSEFIAFL